MDYEAILRSDDTLTHIFLLAALSSNPSLCPADAPSSNLEGHIISRLSEKVFGQDAPPPLCLILFQMNAAWDYLCEPASLDAVLGSAWLLRGAMSLNQPLGQLSKHCHLRASPGESLLTAASLVNDCLFVNTCTQGLVIVPSAAAPAMCDAVSRFVAVATLSSSVRCRKIEAYPIEIAFGYRAKERWFGDFLSDIERYGVEGLEVFGFEVRPGISQNEKALWKAFIKRKQFTELTNLAMIERGKEQPPAPPQDRYEGFGLLAHCTECYARPASFSLSEGRRLCEPCNWRVSVGKKLIENVGGLDGHSLLSDQENLAVVFLSCDPFSLFAESSSAEAAIRAAREQQRAVEETLKEVEGLLSSSCIISRLSPSEALLIVRGGDSNQCLEMLRNVLRQRLAAVEGGAAANVRMAASSEGLRAPLGVLVRDAVTRVFSGNNERVFT